MVAAVYGGGECPSYAVLVSAELIQVAATPGVTLEDSSPLP